MCSPRTMPTNDPGPPESLRFSDLGLMVFPLRQPALMPERRHVLYYCKWLVSWLRSAVPGLTLLSDVRSVVPGWHRLKLDQGISDQRKAEPGPVFENKTHSPNQLELRAIAGAWQYSSGLWPKGFYLRLVGLHSIQHGHTSSSN
jgi:hypothetical protein